MRDCAAASARGRRCAAKAATIDALDDCLATGDEGGTDGGALPDEAPD